jgi:hypothetical protein
MTREPSAAPALAVELAIVLAAGALMAWAAPVHTSALEAARAEALAHAARAEQLAAIVTGCLNGGTITVGADAVVCRPR